MVTIRQCNCETRWIFALIRHEPGLLKTLGILLGFLEVVYSTSEENYYLSQTVLF